MSHWLCAGVCAVFVAVATPSDARDTAPTFEELLEGASFVGIVRVESVQELDFTAFSKERQDGPEPRIDAALFEPFIVERIRVAEARVIESWNVPGSVAPRRVAFVASKRWACDGSTAHVGEVALVALMAATVPTVASSAYIKELQRRLPRSAPLFLISSSGRGRMPLAGGADASAVHVGAFVPSTWLDKKGLLPLARARSVMTELARKQGRKQKR